MCRCNFLLSNILLIPATPSNKSPLSPTHAQTHARTNTRTHKHKHTGAGLTQRRAENKLMQHRCRVDRRPLGSTQRCSKYQISVSVVILNTKQAGKTSQVPQSGPIRVFESRFLETTCRPGSCWLSPTVQFQQLQQKAELALKPRYLTLQPSPT